MNDRIVVIYNVYFFFWFFEWYFMFQRFILGQDDYKKFILLGLGLFFEGERVEGFEIEIVVWDGFKFEIILLQKLSYLLRKELRIFLKCDQVKLF